MNVRSGPKAKRKGMRKSKPRIKGDNQLTKKTNRALKRERKKRAKIEHLPPLEGVNEWDNFK